MNNTNKKISDELRSLLDSVDEIATLGENSVVRRIKSKLITAVKSISKDLDEPIKTREFNRYCDEPRDPLEPEPFQQRAFTLENVIHEFQEDDRRRTVFVDPEEAIIANFVDYYSGRIKHIELTTPKVIDNFEELKEKALAYMKGKYPMVSINNALVKSDEELVYELRALADEVERDSSLLASRNCNRRRESLGTRWENNGRTLLRGYRIVEQCCTTPDPCCGNYTCSEKTVGGGWNVVWTDGNSGNAPPVTPDNFKPQQWNNELPFFDEPNQGTLTSDWGWRRLKNSNGTYRKDFHGGIDIAMPAGTPVQSIGVGEVVKTWQDGHDSYVILQNSGVTHTYYHVIPSPNIIEGDVIDIGDTIGNIAGGGAEHLHYSEHEPPQGDWTLRNDGNSMNPLD